MAADEATWAMLAPAVKDELQVRVDEYWEDTVGADADFMDKWEVIGCSQGYSAVIDRNPGSEQTHEVALAEQLSRELPREVYVLYLHESAGAHAVHVYRSGRRTETRPNPLALAKNLGCTLPGEQPEEAGPRVRGVILVEGASDAEVARALGMSAPPRGPVHIENAARGALMYNEEVGSAPPVMRRLTRALPHANVYTLSTGPEPGRFVLRVMKGGEDVETFDISESDTSARAPTISPIAGKTDPRDIAETLGVPLKLLNLE